MKHNAKLKTSRPGAGNRRNGSKGKKRNPDFTQTAAAAGNVTTYSYNPPSASTDVPVVYDYWGSDSPDWVTHFMYDDNDRLIASWSGELACVQPRGKSASAEPSQRSKRRAAGRSRKKTTARA